MDSSSVTGVSRSALLHYFRVEVVNNDPVGPGSTFHAVARLMAHDHLVCEHGRGGEAAAYLCTLACPSKHACHLSAELEDWKALHVVQSW